MSKSPETPRNPKAGTDDVVILVHGTFAADKDRNDTGHRWWQRDSATWRELQARLPEGVRLPGRNVQLFHWSGANAQSERLHAGNALLARLIKLERQGRGYHLIGHSHGGSVIWEALTTAAVIRETGEVDPELINLLTQLKVIRDVPRVSSRDRRIHRVTIATNDAQVLRHLKLDGLRSWTTVGTPFLRFLPSRRRFVDGWPHPAYSLADKKQRTSRNVSDVVFSITSVLLTLVGCVSVALFISAVFPKSRPSPTAGASPYRGSVWWPLLGLAAGGIGYAMGAAITNGLARSLEVRERASRAAFTRHAGRWLGIWAPTDEAITLLRTAAPGREADYRTLFTPRAARTAQTVGQFAAESSLTPWKLPVRLRLPPGRVGLVPKAMSHRPGSGIVAPVYFLFNRLVAPRLANQLSRTMVRTVQGSDIAGAELVFASPWPIPLDVPPPGLPADVAERLEAGARSSSAGLIPLSREVMTRAALGLPAVVDSLAEARAGADGGGSPLVHTGYFEDPFVLELIVEHIRRGRGGAKDADTEPQAAGDQACAWLDATAAQVAERLEASRSAAETP